MKYTGKIALALALGLAFVQFAGPKWSSWNETIPAVAFVFGACFLAGMSVGRAIHGSGSLVAIFAFALAFLLSPILNGDSRRLPSVEFIGAAEALPALAGGFSGRFLPGPNARILYALAGAILSMGMLVIGPSR